MDHAYKAARKKVKRKKKFYKELISFTSISVGFVLFNLLTSPHNIWVYWVIGPWGITLAVRGLQMMMDDRTDEWEEQEMRRQLSARGKNPDDYLGNQLELRELDRRTHNRQGGYRDSDFV